MSKRRLILNENQIPDLVVSPKFISSNLTFHLLQLYTWQGCFNIVNGSAVFAPSEMLEGAQYEIEITVFEQGSRESGLETKYYSLTFTSDVANVLSRTMCISNLNYQSQSILCKLKFLLSFEGATAGSRTARFKLLDANGINPANSIFGMYGGGYMYNFVFDASVNQTLQLYFQWTWSGATYNGTTNATIVSHAKCQKII